VPREVQPARSLLHRPHAVLPAVVGHEVAAGIPDRGDPELANEAGDVPAQAELVGARVIRFVDPGVDAPAHVLDEGAEEATRDVRDGERRVGEQPAFTHPAHPPERAATAQCLRS
jgi:hypothetical protein